MKRLTATDIFLTFLALILIGISFYQTWIGLEQIFGPASMPISLVLSSLLLFLNYLLRNARLDGKPTGGLTGIYIFVALFCFIANFNALYTRFMKTDIYGNELRLLNNSFNKLETDVATKFNYKYPPDVSQQVEAKKKQLIEQIQDPGNPGIGTRAQSIIKDIERLMGDKIDVLSPVGNDYTDLAVRMGKQIDAMILNLSPQETDLKSDITKGVLKYNKKIQELITLTKTEVDDNSQRLIEEAIIDYNKLGSKAQSILGEEKFKFAPMASRTQEIGKIGYAFSHAFQNFGIYPIIVLLGCLVLDFLIPILILLIVKPNDNSSSGGGWNTKRTGRVLTPNS